MITAVTWLPVEAVRGLQRLPLAVQPTEHDEPPPAALGDLDELRRANAFRDANELRAWIDVEDGAIVGHGYSGRDLVPDSPPAGGAEIAFPTVALPVRREEPELADGRVRFLQTAGAVIGLPAPRPIPGKPFVHIAPVSAWTTLELVLHADGRSHAALVGASPFPRHSIYGPDGRLVRTTEAINLAAWYGESLGETPWGAAGGPSFARVVASELERELARTILASGAPLTRRRLVTGETLVKQGERGAEVFLLLLGALDVEVDGEIVAQVGGGAIVGERALLEGGRRTATLRAATPSSVAVLPPDRIERSKLAELSRTRP
jgi:hypothetical protein